MKVISHGTYGTWAHLVDDVLPGRRGRGRRAYRLQVTAPHHQKDTQGSAMYDWVSRGSMVGLETQGIVQYVGCLRVSGQ